MSQRNKSRNKLCSNLLTYCSSISYKKDVVIPYFSENIHECYSYILYIHILIISWRLWNKSLTWSELDYGRYKM